MQILRRQSRRRALAALLAMATAQETLVLGAYAPPTENYDRCLTTDEAADVAAAIDAGGDDAVDLFPHKVTPDQSSHWTVSYHGTYKILANIDVKVNTTYLVYQCGLPVPSLDDTNFDGVYPAPFDGGLVVTSTTQIPYIEILGRRTQITAFTTTENSISSPCLSQIVIPEGKTDGSIEMIQPYNSTLVTEYIADHPDVMVFDSPWANDMRADRFIIISDTSEDPNLANENGVDVNEAIFEWLEFYAAFFNQEQLATEKVAETKDRYNCHQENSAVIVAESSRKLQLTRALAEDENDQPVILWANLYDGVGWQVGKCPNYYCTYAANCGANMLHSDEGSIVDWGYKYMNDTEFLEFGKEADVWIYPAGNWNIILPKKFELLSAFKSMKNKEVYDYQGSGSNAWFEQRYAEYDTVLLDFCDVVGHTPATDLAHERKWFRNVDDGPVGTLGICTDANETFEPQITECTRIVADPPTSAPTAGSTLAPTPTATAGPSSAPTVSDTLTSASIKRFLPVGFGLTVSMAAFTAHQFL